MGLSYNSIESTTNIVLAAKIKDVRFSPLPGTFMDKVVNSTTPVIGEIDNYSTYDPNDFDNNIEYLTKVADELLSLSHAKAITLTSTKLAEQAEKILLLTRKEIVPVLTSLVDRTLSDIKDRKLEGIHNYSVRPYAPSEILFSEFMQDIMENTAPQRKTWSWTNTFKTRRFYEPRTIEELLLLLRNEHPGLDNLITKAKEFYGNTVIQNAYDIFFNKTPDPRRFTLMPEDLLSDKAYEGERLFAILFALSLRNDPPEGLNLTLSDISIYLSNVIAFNGSSLERYMSNYKARADKRYLDIRRDPEKTNNQTVYLVNDISYKYWKDKGLTDETILGAMSGDGIKDAEKILEKKEYYEDVWKQQTAIKERTMDSLIQDTLMKSIRTIIKDHAKSFFGDTYHVEANKVDKKINDIFKLINPKTDEDIYPTIREAVLCIFYPEPSISIFLKSMDEILKSSPAINPRQAAGLAFIDLGVSWLLSQVTVV
jgi:hypothetical protein